MKGRRDAFVAGVAWLVSTRLALAQAQAARTARIGWLGNTKPQSAEALAIWDAFRLELQRRGWVEGVNLVFERRFAEGAVDRWPQFARELAELGVDVIVAVSGSAALAAKQATARIPIVFGSVGDPVGQGLVASLGRPSGNLTGLATQSGELTGKRLALLKEAVPRIAQVGVLSSDESALARDDLQEAVRAASNLRLRLLPAQAARAEDLAVALAKPRAEAWFVLASSLYFAQHKAIVELIAAQRKPASYPSVIYVQAGGLMALAVDLKDQFRRVAILVDKILHGARPADLPVEQPTRFELVINLKTARALGLTIPQALLLRADEVIE
jgi:putative tryptophan/tyrosine transport system substrate-binding protein